MRIANGVASVFAAAGLLVAACSGGEEQAQANPCNPCAPNPCAANPCAQGASVDPARVTQGSNQLHTGTPEAQLLARGSELWNDPSLSGSGGIACSTCHVDNYQQMQATFAQPYPHAVAMASARAGVAQVNAAEMVQLCMVIPMGADPLPWNSVELAALTTYVRDIQRGFDPSAAAGQANPCNPCGGGNPCNPCGGT